MVEIKDFPSYGWICKLNKPRYFSGSIGTNGTKGTFVVPTFQYQIWREDGTLCASCYVRMPDGSTFGEEKIEMDLSPENAEVVKNWLAEQVAAHPEVAA